MNSSSALFLATTAVHTHKHIALGATLGGTHERPLGHQSYGSTATATTILLGMVRGLTDKDIRLY